MADDRSSGASKIRICIVGAGVSGLCACRQLLRHGLQPTVLEASGCVGGVWQSNSVSITKLQTPSLAYQYSDFPWPDGTPEHASGQEVLDYLEAYALHFGIMERIRFNSRVLGIRKLGEDDDESGELGVWGEDKRAWEVLVEQKQESTECGNNEKLEFDFVILCIGRFGDVPKLPSFPKGKGPEVFKGKVMHSSQYSVLDNAVKLLAGNRVVVVGFSKSALDIAAEAAHANEGFDGYPCTLVYRQAHWIVPHWRVFGVHLSYLYCSRLSEMLVCKPGQGLLSTIVSTILFPVKWVVSKLVEVYLRLRLPLSKYGLVPNQSFHQQFSSCKISVIPENFFENVKEGRINLCKSPNWNFSERGVILDDNREVEADVVTLCTGFEGETKLKSVLPNKYADVLQGPGGVVPLYRGVIHPRIPGMGILGYQEDISNLRASEMGARWLAHFLSDKFKLPDVKTMEKDTDSWLHYMKSSTPFYSRACVAAIRTWHTDQLCRDIGWNPKRKKTWLEELLSPYSNMDYRDSE